MRLCVTASTNEYASARLQMSTSPRLGLMARRECHVLTDGNVSFCRGSTRSMATCACGRQRRIAVAGRPDTAMFRGGRDLIPRPPSGDCRTGNGTRSHAVSVVRARLSQPSTAGRLAPTESAHASWYAQDGTPEGSAPECFSKSSWLRGRPIFLKNASKKWRARGGHPPALEARVTLSRCG